MKVRDFYYQKNKPSGIPSDFPHKTTFFVHHDVFHSRYGSWKRYLMFGGIRYALVVEHNARIEKCVENDILEAIYGCFDEEAATTGDIFRSKIDGALNSGMDAFWTYLKEDYARRESCAGLMEPYGALDFDRADHHSIQLKTLDGGDVRCVAGYTRDESAFRPKPNVYPQYRTFHRKDVEVIEKITECVFKVRIEGNVYCLKGGRRDIDETIRKFSSLFSSLTAVAPIPYVAGMVGLVTNDDEKIIGYVSAYIEGQTLNEVSEACESQKKKWKHQLRCALQWLHERGIVWGDAKPDNIIVDRNDDGVMLIDFDGGGTDGWVDAEVCGSKRGDLQAEQRIREFIDSLPSKSGGC